MNDIPNYDQEIERQHQPATTGEPQYLIMDSRAMSDMDSAMVLDTADSLEEAREACRNQGGGVIFFNNPVDVTEKDFIEYVSF